jgi:hypothetical protein
VRRIIVVALAVLGVCLAATASASAHLFHASKTGKLLGLSEGNQVFTPKAGGAEVICKHAVTTGTITALLGLHQLVTVVYSNCAVLGQTTHISPAEYLLSADGLAAIVNTIFINVLGLAPCQITVKPQDLLHVAYDTDPLNSAALLELSLVHSIVSTGSGGGCGTNNTGGTYTGNNLVFEDGGALGWL